MEIKFELPGMIGEELAKTQIDATATAKEALLCHLYREEVITHAQLCGALGIDRFDGEAVLKRHGVLIGVDEYCR